MHGLLGKDPPPKGPCVSYSMVGEGRSEEVSDAVIPRSYSSAMELSKQGAKDFGLSN